MFCTICCQIKNEICTILSEYLVLRIKHLADSLEHAAINRIDRFPHDPVQTLVHVRVYKYLSVNWGHLTKPASIRLKERFQRQAMQLYGPAVQSDNLLSQL